MYEVSLRVPLIIAGPGVRGAGRRQLRRPLRYLFHTICALAGVDLPEDERFAGESFEPLLRGECVSWDNTRYGEYGDLRMIRDERWKLVWRYPAGPHDLFDLAGGSG